MNANQCIHILSRGPRANTRCDIRVCASSSEFCARHKPKKAAAVAAHAAAAPPQPPLCSICREDIILSSNDKYYLPCGHVYHKACICHWINTNDTCPMCRDKYQMIFKRCTMYVLCDCDDENALQCDAPCVKDSNYCATHQFFINNINFNHDYALDMLRFQRNQIDEEPAQPWLAPNYVTTKHTIHILNRESGGVLMYNKERISRQYNIHI